MGAQRVFLGSLFQHLFSTPFFDGFWLPPGSPNPGRGGTAVHLLVAWGKHTFRHNVVSLWGNAISANLVFPASVGEGNY